PALRRAGRRAAQGVGLRLDRAAADPRHGPHPVRPLHLPAQRHLRAGGRDRAARPRLCLLRPPPLAGPRPEHPPRQPAAELLLHAPGNTFIRDLAPRQRILVQPGGLIWKDTSVRMFLHFEYPRGQYWFSSARYQAKSTWLTLEGPGRIAVQSVFERPEGSGY